MADIGVTWVPYGRGAAEALRAAVAAAKHDDPLAPVTVVVPSNHVGVAARRLLASGQLGPICSVGTGLAAVTFLTPFRLAELLGAARIAATGRRPVSTPVIAAAIRGVLADAAGLFDPVAAHPATESALVSTYRELRDLSEEALDALAGRSDRAREVVRVHRAVCDRLARDWSDEEDLMLAAIEVLDGAEPVSADLGTVVVHLPQRLSRHVGAFLGAVGRRTSVTVLAGTTGDDRADAEVRASLARIGRASPAAPADPSSVTALARGTRFVTASDADEEVRAAVRAVIDAARAETSLDRIAVLYASPEPYARMAHEQLEAAGVPTNGTAVVPLAARVAGRTLVRLLDLATSGFRRQDLFALLAGAPIRHDGRPVPASRWEDISRRAGVVSGRDQWDERLERRATELDDDARRADADPDVAAGRGDWYRSDATSARSLRAFALGLIDEMEHAASRPRTWADHARWARRLLDSLLGPSHGRSSWPLDERSAGERVELAIERLAALDGVEGQVALDVFTRTLILELDNDLGRVGRFGRGVLVGGVAMGIGLDLDLVIVLGLAEGAFPSGMRDDSLLPDSERAAGADGALGDGPTHEATRRPMVDGLPLRRDGVERQHRELLAALAGARDRLLTVPRGDLRRSRDRVASRWALDLASARAETRWWSKDLLGAEVDWVQHVPSFDAGLRLATAPATAQEHRLRSLLATEGGVHTAASLRASDDRVLASAAAVVEGRRSRAFSRFDGHVAGAALPSPLDGSVSATALERWATCPFAYFVGDVLRVAELENPEDDLEITPLDRGKLIHEALERFVAEILDPSTPKPPDQTWTEDDHRRLAEIAEELFGAYEDHGRTGRPIFWRRHRTGMLADLRGLLHADDIHRRAHRTHPIAAELSFGRRDSELDAVALTLPDGGSVRFRGQADRVDLGEDGSLHVIDYKTGKFDPYRGIDEDDPDQRGTKLQLAVYGAAARAQQRRPDARVNAEYLFVSAKVGRYRRIGYPVTAGVLDRVSRSVGTIVAGIDSGTFPSHPTDISTSVYVKCPACDPDGLGVVDLHRAWERKRHDPAMAPYAELADPLDDIEIDVQTGPTGA